MDSWGIDFRLVSVRNMANRIMQAEEHEPGDPPLLRGRPRDSGLDGRVYDAAIALYAEYGWQGFTFEAIARASGVGKGALYRRWTGRDDLLAQTIEARWRGVGEIDTGSLRGDMLMLAQLVFGLLMATHGGVSINMQVDARRFAEVRAIALPFRARQLDRLRLIAERAIARGELAPGIDTRLLTDVLIGAITNHVLATPPELEPAVLAQGDSYLGSLVDLVLNGVGHSHQGTDAIHG